MWIHTFSSTRSTMSRCSERWQWLIACERSNWGELHSLKCNLIAWGTLTMSLKVRIQCESAVQKCYYPTQPEDKTQPALKYPNSFLLSTIFFCFFVTFWLLIAEKIPRQVDTHLCKSKTSQLINSSLDRKV